MKFKDQVFVLGLALLGEGVVSLLLFFIILFVVLLILVYKFALVIVPAFLLALLIAVIVFIPFHYISLATISTRSRRRLAAGLQQLHELEQLDAPPEQQWPVERRLREAAQALADRVYLRWRRRSGAEKRQLQRQLDEIRVTYNVVPQHSRWGRFTRLHLERSWVKHLVENPAQARLVILLVAVVLTTLVAGMFRES